MVLSDEILKIKRCSVLLIVLFLTLGTLYLIRSTFASKEIIVTAEIKTEKPLTVQVFYTETANKNFNGPESVTAKVPYLNTTLKKSPRAFIISDSFVLCYINYMQNHYSQIVHIYVGDGREFELDKYGDKINELKPDMIIISSCERFLERLKELHQPKE